MNVETRSTEINTPDGAMAAFVARPKGASDKLPAMIVVQEAFGLNKNIEAIAERIAGEGYHVVAPNFYYREGGKAVGYDKLQDAIGLMIRWTDEQIVTDVRAAVQALAKDGGVRGDRIGITGFCMGGRVSYLAACEIPELRAAVERHGGGIAGNQFAPGATPPVSRTSKMKAAIQLHFGENDGFIPLAAVEEIRDTLAREKKTAEVHVYKGAGHGFFCNERADYDAEAAALAWERMRTFLAKHLKS
jgi:carboxymethylenebutenolidase